MKTNINHVGSLLGELLEREVLSNIEESQEDLSTKKRLNQLKKEIFNNNKKDLTDQKDRINPQDETLNKTALDQQTPEELQKLIDQLYGYLTYNTDQLKKALDDAPNYSYKKEFEKGDYLYYSDNGASYISFKYGSYNAYIDVNKDYDGNFYIHIFKANERSDYIIYSSEKDIIIETTKDNMSITPDNIKSRLPIIQRANDAVYFAAQKQLKRNQKEFERMKKY